MARSQGTQRRELIRAVVISAVIVVVYIAVLNWPVLHFAVRPG